MKRGTKIWLIVALIFGLIGGGLCLSAAILGVSMDDVNHNGCFVELWPGCEGLVHVSELDHKRVDKPKELVSVGDKILVKALGYDNRGRLNLSRKQALPKSDKTDDKKKK